MTSCSPLPEFPERRGSAVGSGESREAGSPHPTRIRYGNYEMKYYAICDRLDASWGISFDQKEDTCTSGLLGRKT